VGPKCVIGVELTRTALLTMSAVEVRHHRCSTRNFPHTDVVERAEGVLDLVLATLRGQDQAGDVGYDCRQIQSYPTTNPADARPGSTASWRWSGQDGFTWSGRRSLLPVR